MISCGWLSRAAALAAAGLVLSCGHKAPVKPVTAPKPTAKPAAPRKGRVTAMDLSTLFTLQQGDKVLLYDVRPSFVFAFGHLPTAFNWPRHSFDGELAQREVEIKAAIATDRIVVLYCTDAACPDAAAVAERLSALGHSVSVLDGGFAAWKDAGMTIE